MMILNSLFGGRKSRFVR